MLDVGEAIPILCEVPHHSTLSQPPLAKGAAVGGGVDRRSFTKIGMKGSDYLLSFVFI